MYRLERLGFHKGRLVVTAFFNKLVGILGRWFHTNTSCLRTRLSALRY